MELGYDTGPLAIGRTVLTSALTLSKLEAHQQNGEALHGAGAKGGPKIRPSVARAVAQV